MAVLIILTFTLLYQVNEATIHHRPPPGFFHTANSVKFIHQLSYDLVDYDKLLDSINYTWFDGTLWPRDLYSYYYKKFDNGTILKIGRNIRIKSYERMGWDDYEFNKQFAVIWPDRTVYFIFKSNVSEGVKFYLAFVFKYIQKYSCIKFVYLPTVLHEYGRRCLAEEKPLEIRHTSESRCYATVGYMVEPDRKNVLYINEHICGSSFLDVMHLIMHVLGMNHEFTRRDRDDYIKSLTIPPRWKDLFDKDRHNPSHTFTPYNAYSLLHIRNGVLNTSFDYKRYDKPQDRLISKVIREPNILTFLDMVKLNRIYQCGEQFRDCIDNSPKDKCDIQGMGRYYYKQQKKHVHRIELARCAQRNPAFDNCRKTCGHCYKYLSEESRRFQYVNDMMNTRPIASNYWRTCFVEEDFKKPRPPWDNINRTWEDMGDRKRLFND